MRTLRREFLTCLLVLCLVSFPLAVYAQDKPAEGSDSTGNSAENVRAQREFEKAGKELSPEDRAKEETKRRNCLGCTAEDRRTWEVFDASKAAAKAKHAEEIRIAEISNTLLNPSVDTFLVAPSTSEEYVRIFGTNGANPQDLTTAQTSEIRRIRQMRGDFGQSSGSRNLNSRNFKATIANSQASFILILGHNDRGSFRFVDGSSVLLDDLVTASKPYQRMIIVSCKAEAMLSNQTGPKAAATRDDLTYAQAFEIAKTVQKYLASAGPRVSVEMVRRALQSAESKSAFKYNTGTIVGRASFATAGTIVIALVISGGVRCLITEDCR